ncbi:hypothetical protein M23134_03063 [Microscilla marina ATCC 23134]|uniref:Uncharacterized protein n=1 Tax=Microscilla marina ATCC 23134 TaxID=313606 RepID=A1ZG10_MICM2|nr:hypothetical protein M23134_03063 [Microscilla marina ATCC 23134]
MDILPIVLVMYPRRTLQNIFNKKVKVWQSQSFFLPEPKGTGASK